MFYVKIVYSKISPLWAHLTAEFLNGRPPIQRIALDSNCFTENLEFTINILKIHMKYFELMLQEFSENKVEQVSDVESSFLN